MQARADSGPYQDHGASEFGGPKKFQTAARNPETCRILHKVHQGLCLDYRADGEIAENGCYILL